MYKIQHKNNNEVTVIIDQSSVLKCTWTHPGTYNQMPSNRNEQDIAYLVHKLQPDNNNVSTVMIGQNSILKCT